ncbi:CocE/NonD family hydrolase [Nocardiopsis tropica]|uniref:alpha/beta hydrolase family protein n=1 Tax=Tsukamurella strandjordii TaxID=147577 RepID=UPI0031DF8547
MKSRYYALGALLLAVVVVLGGGAWVVGANTFGYDEQRVTIPVTDALAAGGSAPDAHTEGRLDGLLTTPKGSSGPHGLVVMVHGDGAANATRDDGYKPLSEAFAKAGFATLAWNKAGVDGSPGNWLQQSLADRGAEVAAALDWARGRPDIDRSRIGAWGVSQAGWVLPEISARRPDIRFLILVGAAVNWLRQGEYNTLAELRAAGASDEDRTRALDRRAASVALLRQGADYGTYLASTVDDPPMSADRWGFVERNFRADVTPAIPAIAVPTLLILGDADRNVDVDETARAYEAGMRPGLLTEHRFPGATHSITRDDIEYRADELTVAARAIFAPRSIYAPGYLDLLTRFTQQQGAR